MAKQTTAEKNEYNSKNYDRIYLVVPKGKKELWKEKADAQNMSLNSYITKCVDESEENKK